MSFGEEYCGYIADRFSWYIGGIAVESADRFQAIFLPNDKVMDSEILLKALKNKSADYVICFGQKPLIKNKITVETTARDGEICLHTAFDCEKMLALFVRSGVAAKISHNAGTSFCNRLYYNLLNYLAQNSSKTRAVFIHIPFAKNIDDFGGFADKVFGVIRRYHSNSIDD